MYDGALSLPQRYFFIPPIQRNDHSSYRFHVYQNHSGGGAINTGVSIRKCSVSIRLPFSFDPYLLVVCPLCSNYLISVCLSKCFVTSQRPLGSDHIVLASQSHGSSLAKHLTVFTHDFHVLRSNTPNAARLGVHSLLYIIVSRAGMGILNSSSLLSFNVRRLRSNVPVLFDVIPLEYPILRPIPGYSISE